MELRHIRYFVRAAEFLHFTRAAECLGVSQPTLSLHIQQLEKEVGAPLFDRTGGHVRRVRLTQAGQRLLAHAHDILRAVERGKQEIADLRGLLSGSVTLGVNNIFVPKLMSKCLPSYSAAHPGIDVIVKMANQEALESAILSGTMDLALAWLPPESKEIAAEALFRDELVVVVSVKHPLADLEQITLRQLDNLPVALPTVATNIRRLVNAEFAKQDVCLRTSLEIDDTPARLKAYLAPLSGDFIGLTGDPGLTAEIAARFAAVFFKEPAAKDGSYNVQHSTQVFAIDKAGRLRATFADASVEDMAKVTALLLQEPG